MGVSIGGAKKKFAHIVDELHTEPPMMSQFAVWLDLKLAEYKLQGDMRLDFHDCVSAPDWMKGSKCQCLERAQLSLAARNGKNAWRFAESRESTPMVKKVGETSRIHVPPKTGHHVMAKSEFDRDPMDLDDFEEPEGHEFDIDAQHPLVQLLSKKSKKKTVGTGRRGRPKGVAGVTITETGVRVKRVVAKRKEPESFPERPEGKQEEKFLPPPVVHSAITKTESTPDSSLQQKVETSTEQPKTMAVKLPEEFKAQTQAQQHPRSPSIPDLTDDELLDTFNEHDDDDDCSFGSVTPPDSPEHGLPQQPRPPIPAQAIRQMPKPPETMAATSVPNFRPSFPGNPGQMNQPQGYFRGFAPPHRESMSNVRSQSPHHPPQITNPQPHHPSTQLTPQQQQHQQQQQFGMSPGPLTNPHPPSFPAHSTQSQPTSSAGPAFVQAQAMAQPSQSPNNPLGSNLRLDRYKTPLQAPQSLLRTADSSEAMKMGMELGLDTFDDFYDDDFGTGTDEDDIIALEYDDDDDVDDDDDDEMLDHSTMGSPGDSMPDTVSLPERSSGSQAHISNPRPVVSDPGSTAHRELDESAPKKRKYNRKSDTIKVPKDVRVTVHTIVKDLKTQNPNLEWDFTKGLSDEWNSEMNSKILALVENRMGQVEEETCMKAINCYFVSRKAQWRKQQSGASEDGKKKVKINPKSDQEEPPPPAE